MSQSWIRNASFFMKGMKEFTRGGYEKASKAFQAGDIDTDMTGRSCLVTGANSGIGYCVALNLARAGATVHMVCRNEQRGVEARQRIMDATGSQKVHLHICDLSQTRDVLRFCSEFVGTGTPLDVLVHNAGCMVHTRTTNEDDLEVNFATNTLAPYFITNQFIPLLEKSQDPRVIFVSSGGMYTVKLVPDDFNSARLHKFDGTFVYAENKRQQVVMNRSFAKLYPSIHFSAMHPGWADTPAVESAMPTFHKLLRSKLRTPDQGADTAHWLCVTRRIREFPSGSFFLDRQVMPEHLNSGTHSTGEEEEVLIRGLQELQQRFLSPAPPPVSSGATPNPVPQTPSEQSDEPPV